MFEMLPELDVHRETPELILGKGIVSGEKIRIFVELGMRMELIYITELK